MAGQGASAQSSVIASWVQYAPGSSVAALAAGSWGDQPNSLNPTILVRAIVTDATSCPAATLDHITPLTMKQRFIGSALTNTPGTPGATNGKAGYPQYFVSPTATSAANFANGEPMATTSWGECEAVVQPGHTRVTVGGVEMKLPVAKPRRILVMGDTGCRLNGALSSNGSNQQNCSDPTAFPFAYLSTYEATFKPDVILQVGDWFYRDTNCLTNGSETFPGCNTPSSPNYETWGDTFDSWNADVFFPAKTLLAAAPWIMVRGNHESCGRGARGWFATLDPYPYNYNNVVCPKTNTYPAPGSNTATYNGDFEASYVVPANNVNILVHDSSFANDSAVDTNMAANYDIDLSNLLAAVKAAAPAAQNIFATHKPTFGLSYGTAPTGCATGPNGQSNNGGDWTEQSVFNGGTGYTASAFKDGVPDSIGLFLSGHIHQFQYVNFPPRKVLNKSFAPQLVVGTGGSLLDADCNTGLVPPGNTNQPPFGQLRFPYTVQATGGTTGSLSNTYSHDEFGFALFEAVLDKPTGNVTAYNASIYTISASLAGHCRIDLSPRKIACRF
ncbi:MAG: metallophosphoesterase [Rhodospirillales bacterium]